MLEQQTRVCQPISTGLERRQGLLIALNADDVASVVALLRLKQPLKARGTNRVHGYQAPGF
jgi:hypothetical protein